MIIRIVKLQFQENRINEFLDFFETVKFQINSFPGCQGMKLLHDIKTPTIVMTYSHWDNEAALNAYRDSELFGSVWPKIKPWFDARPEAWSVTEHFNGFDIEADSNFKKK